MMDVYGNLVDDAELAGQSPTSTGTALLLDLFLPGAGHIYGSGGDEGIWLLIANLLCASTVPFIYVTFAGNLIFWVYALATVNSVTKAHNTAIRQAIERQRIVASTEQDRAQDRRQLEETKQKLLVTGRDLAIELNKLDGLRRMKVISATEFADQKKALCDGLSGKKTKESMADFFLPLAPLVESKVLTDEDLKSVKLIFSLISQA